jgi:hypothetical protein
MYIEDLIQRLACDGQYLFAARLNLLTRDISLINSFSDQLNRGNSFSEKQADIAVKFCTKYKDQLGTALNRDVSSFVENPSFKFPPRKLSVQYKKVEIIDSPVKAVKATFPYDEKLVAEIRKFKDVNHIDTAVWDQEEKAWMFTLSETSVFWIKNTLVPLGFQTCEKFDEICNQIDEISANFEQFVPRLTLTETGFAYVNTHPSIPQPEGKEFIETLFEAKRYGITTWDELIEEALKSGDFPKITKKFLGLGMKTKLEVDSSRYDIEVFDDIIKYATPCLIIIPAGSEITNLKKWYGYLNSKNIQKSDISVMFRTENGNDRIFNELVKEYGLNSPIGENTKFVFVSQKLPKPVIKSKIQFNCVINLGSINGVHFTLTSFLQDFPDIILYNDKGTQGTSSGKLQNYY